MRKALVTFFLVVCSASFTLLMFNLFSIAQVFEPTSKPSVAPASKEAPQSQDSY